MTEYTTSSQAMREHMTSRDRTAYWVQSHPMEGNEFYSPSVPPSVLSDVSYDNSDAVSESESIRSVPPRMVLRYGGGRPDVPIPIEDPRVRSIPRRDDSVSNSSNRSPTSTTSPTFPQKMNYRSNPYSNHHSNHPLSISGSYGSMPLSQLSQQRSPLAPEEIRVLPSQPRASSSSRQVRSKSLPRSINPPSHTAPPLPGPMPPHGPGSGQEATQAWHMYARGRSHHPTKQPPAIIYAPSSTSSRPHYAPPPIFNHPPQIGPDGMVYSHSAPVQSLSYPKYSGGHPTMMVPSSHDLTAYHGEDRRADTWNGRRKERPQLPPLSRSSSSSSLNSRRTGSTYYVMPSVGQKVHVISPSPQPSIRTAIPTSRSPISPQYIQSHPMRKVSFFQRLRSLAGRISSVKSSTGSIISPSTYKRGHRLHRRHSTGGTVRSTSRVH